MARDKERIAQRNKLIYQAYLELYNKKSNGVRIYNYAYIEDKLAIDYFLNPATIGRIILEQEKLEPSR